MNILILNWRDVKHPNAGGAEQATFEHAKAWVNKGHKVWWFSSSFSWAKKTESIKKVKVIRSGRQFFDVQLRAFFWYFFGKHPKFNLVIDQFHGIPFFTPLYVRAKKLAFIHEVAKEVWRLNPWPKPFNLLPAVFGPLIEPLIFRLFYKDTPFMTVSESTKTDLIKFCIPESNIFVIHNGVDLSAMPGKLPRKEKKKTAIFLGAFAKDKGFEDALKAFAEVKRKDKGWQFWMVGKASPNMADLVENIAEKLGLGDSFKFWGYVSDEKKFELLARAHVLINPSYHEGWGLVNIEANTVGTPIVGYNVHGVRDSVRDGETGTLCKERTPSCLANETIKLVKNSTKYKKLCINAISWSKKFTWEKSVQESLELIGSL